MSKWRANKKYRPYQIALPCWEHCFTGDQIIGKTQVWIICSAPQVTHIKNVQHERKPHVIFQFFHLFGLFEAIAAYNAWNYNKSFHQDWGKNSLDVIGHTHTSGLCLSPIRHSGGVCGPSRGASQSVHSPAFFTTSKCAPAWQIISLAELQHSHRPVRPIYLLYEEELTLEETRKWDFLKNFLHSGVAVLCNMSSCQGGAEEGKSVRMQLTQLFISTFYSLSQARGGETIYEHA